MAVKISQLPAVVTPAPTDTFPVIQGGVTKKETVSQVLTGNSVVIGAASATDNAITRFDGITGKLIQNSPVTLSDTGAMVFPSGQSINMPGASFINANSFNGSAVQFTGGDGSNIIVLEAGETDALTVTDGVAPNGYFTINTTAQNFTFNVPVTITKSSSGDFIANLSNTGSGNASWQISSSADSYTNYYLISSVNWVTGIDSNSNGDYRISQTAFGTSDWMFFDTLNTRAQFYNPIYVPKITLTGDASHIGIDFVGTDGNNIIQVPNNELEALKAVDPAGNEYFHLNSQTNLPKFSTDVILQNNTVFIETLSAAYASTYNTSGTLSASCSGNTVTGSGTTFPNSSATNNCVNGIIYWPSTQNVARITQVNSATSLTIDGAGFSQTNAPFIIYYNGVTWNTNSDTFAIASNTTLNSAGQIKLKPSILLSTMSQTGILATITGASSILAGAYVVPASGSPFTIVSYQGTSTVPTNVSQTIGGGTACTIYYFPFTSGGMIDVDNSASGSSLTLYQNVRYLTIGFLGASVGVNSNLAVSRSFTSSGVGTAQQNNSNNAASQSGTTITGVGVSWDATYIGHLFRFATGETAWITACPSSTTFTVTPSQTVAATDFDIPGKTTTNEATSMDARGNFGTVNAYISGTLNVAGTAISFPLSLANGGTNGNLTASNGGIFYSTASAGAILSGTATAQQLLMSGASTAPIWSTTTYPTTNAVNTLLYASSANTMAALATANSGVLVTSASGVPSISTAIPAGVTMQGLPMTVVSGTTQAAAVNNSYVSNNAGLVTVTLPSTAVVGDTIQIGGLGAGGWKVAQNASQLIHIGSSVTTTGTGGSLASSNQYDAITYIRCVVANTTWSCYGVQGNITVI